MKILAIDTSTVQGSVAILAGEKIFEENYLADSSHAETLLQVVEKVLSKARLKIKDIEGIAVGIGPGSFTGLRIGLATAKGIAFANQIPIVGISSLRAIAEHVIASGAKQSSELIVPVINAKRGEVYAAAYTSSCYGAAVLRCCGEIVINECAISEEELKEKLENLGRKYHIEKTYPLASNVARLALEQFEQSNTDDLSSLIPNYIRKSAAEAKIDKSNNNAYALDTH